MIEIKYNHHPFLLLENVTSIDQLHCEVYKKLQHQDFYLLHNGKHLIDDLPFTCNEIMHVVPKLVGGKGGFGSMLRAIGAQIEKTTNREACRDLSGRRLRDINEEKRLKAWIDKQATREQEAEDKRQRKLESLMQTPKHEFKDATYDKERSNLPERLEDAVSQGMEAVATATTSSATSTKRKGDAGTDVLKKKRKFWFDDDVEISSGDDSAEYSDSDADESAPKSNKTDEHSKLKQITAAN